MNHFFVAIAVLLTAFLATSGSRALAAPAAAPGFVVENAIPGSHIEAPVALAFTPDGRLLVADVPGRIWVIKNGVQQPVPMWAHENEVEINGDCGLLGMALDPAFATNRRLYLLYAVDPDSNGVDDDSLHFGRLVRYQTSASNPDLIDESTRTVLLGTGWADGIPNHSGTHSVGALRFAEDGTLLVSAGEGARYDIADPGGLSPGLFLPGFAPPAWDRGAYRSQMLDCPGGKILRVDPVTGHGLPSNPFWNGDPGSVQSKVWAYGLRNPYRFCVRPLTGTIDPAAGDPGTLYVGDVGWNRWEELNVAPQGGLDFGWPCREGIRANAPYTATNTAKDHCANPGGTTAPTLAFSHVHADTSSPVHLRGNAITSGLFYAHTQFPQPWRGRLVFGDFYRGWIQMAQFDAAERFVTSDGLATGMNGPVDFAIEPSTGYLYVACIIDDRVRRIRWSPTAAVEGREEDIALSAPAPNPSWRGATLTLSLPRAGRVSFELFDSMGRRVWSESERERGAGRVTLAWDGRDAHGAAAAPGLYLARVQALGATFTRRMIVLDSAP